MTEHDDRLRRDDAALPPAEIPATPGHPADRSRDEALPPHAGSAPPAQDRSATEQQPPFWSPASAPGDGPRGEPLPPDADGYGTAGPAYTEPLPAYGSPPPTGENPRGRRRRTRLTAAAALVALALGSGVTGGVVVRALDGSPTVVTAATTAPAANTGTSPTEQLAKTAALVQPSVVSITVSGNGGSAEGSGVILRSDGMILTNNHVVADAAQGATLRVRFADGKTASADLVGRDPSVDLAVIKAKGVAGLTPATFGSSRDLHVGDTVLAVGSPLGLDGSVSAGIVSALHRTINLGGSQNQSPFGGQDQQNTATVGDAVQTDAAINPGNSGGPLVDAAGRVVGINTAIASLGSGFGGQSGSIGLGFAIPVDEAKRVAAALISGQQPKRALLGVQVSDAPQGGALVGSVTPSSAASDAGLQEGDVVTAVDGQDVSDGSGLTAAVRAHKPGDKIRITYTRNDSSHTVTVTLGSAGA